MNECVFCGLAEGVIRDGWRIVHDKYPCVKNHTLIISVRHVDRLHELNEVEWAGLIALLKTLKGDFNFGINNGERAGRTVPHLHFHVMPVEVAAEPVRPGGIRWIYPKKAQYGELK